MAGYRPAYSAREEREMLRFIIDKNAYSKILSKQLYIDMEKEPFTDRTWQSLHEHMRKKLIHNVGHKIYDLTKQEIKDLREGYAASQRKPTKKVVPEKPFFGDIDWSSSDDDDKNNVRKPEKYSENGTRAWKGEKENNDTVETSNGHRLPYSVEEEKQMLRFIIKKRAYTEMRAKTLFVEMAKAGITDRTWQSLQNHMKKHLIYKLHSVQYGLSSREIRNFKDGFSASSKTKTNNSIDLVDISFSSSDEGNSNDPKKVRQIENTGRQKDPSGSSSSDENDDRRAKKSKIAAMDTSDDTDF